MTSRIDKTGKCGMIGISGITRKTRTSRTTRSSVIFIAFLLLTSKFAFAMKKTIRQENYSKNGVLVSGPSVMDQKIARFLLVNDIKSIEDYAKWLKENIEYSKDGRIDRWAEPLDTLVMKKGDCEDYAFLTMAVMRVMGYQPRFFALFKPGQAHAFCVIKMDGYYAWFDNDQLVKTKRKSLEGFAREITSRFSFRELKELDVETYQWKRLYSKKRNIISKHSGGLN